MALFLYKLEYITPNSEDVQTDYGITAGNNYTDVTHYLEYRYKAENIISLTLDVIEDIFLLNEETYKQLYKQIY